MESLKHGGILPDHPSDGRIGEGEEEGGEMMKGNEEVNENDEDDEINEEQDNGEFSPGSWLVSIALQLQEQHHPSVCLFVVCPYWRSCVCSPY